MFKEVFAKEQPIAYQTLKKAIEGNKLSHAYIFSGVNGSLKKEAAYLLAKTLVCENRRDFACEECDSCQRIENNQYADLIYLDGSQQSIKKDQILNLQQQFNKTGLEIYNQKIYIIDGAENATVEALNSLLKFLEEPSGSSITAILLVEQIDRLLPTIVSRCQTIQFKSVGQKASYKQAIEEGVNLFDAYLLSHLVHNGKDIEKYAEEENYQTAVQLFQSFIQNLIYNVDMTLTRLQIEGFTGKNREGQREILHYLLDFSIVFFKDIDKDVSNTDNWWQKQQESYRQRKVNNQAIIQILLEGRDRLTKNVNVPLLLDQIICEVKEVL